MTPTCLTGLRVRGPRIEQRPLTHVEAAKALREKFSANGHTGRRNITAS